MSILDVSTVEELKATKLPRSWSALERIRHLNPSAPLYRLLNVAPTLSESAYELIHGRSACPCGELCKFKGWKLGYASFCSRNCAHADAATKTRASVKRGNTMLERYGARGSLGSPALLLKIKQTSLARHGQEHAGSTSTAKAKRAGTNLARYGGISPNADDSVRARQVRSQRQSSDARHLALANANGFTLTAGDSQFEGTWICSNGHDVFHRWNTMQRPPICRICTPYIRGTSAEEQQLLSWLREHTAVLDHQRLYQGGRSYYELDAVLPTQQLAIEYNGLYWHSELAGKEPHYHLNKLLAANRAGLQLIQIFEHEWRHKRDICQSILKAKLGLSEHRIGARELKLAQLSKVEAEEFFTRYHLAGSAYFTRAWGLQCAGVTLVAACWAPDRFARVKTHMELVRYATAPGWSVPGGLSRLTKVALEQLQQPLRTFCDRRWSTGSGYLRAGWRQIGISKPGYWYFKDDQVHHRSAFQRRRLLELTGRTGTEWELAQAYGLNRFWDCGNIILEKT